MAVEVAEPRALGAPLGLFGSTGDIRARRGGALECGVDVLFNEIQPGRGTDASLSAASHDHGITAVELGVRNDAVVTLNRGGLEAEALDEKSQ